jgi:hypothetical protein
METTEIILDATTTRVVDLLQQINNLNTMIDLHRTASKDDFMRQQYEYKKTEMMHELETLLQSFQIAARLDNAA